MPEPGHIRQLEVGICFFCEDEVIFNHLEVGKLPQRTSDLDMRQAVPPSQRRQECSQLENMRLGLRRPVLPLTSYATLGKSPNLSKASVSHP